MKKIRIPLMLLVALTLTLGVTAPSFAQKGMGPKGMGPGCPPGMGLSPEQAGQMFDLRHKFMNETADLRKQMVMKRAEMAALWKAETPDQNLIRAKQKEMNALRDQMQEKMLAFKMQVRQVCPMGLRGGMGMGPGCGMGPGMGPGMAMGPCMDMDGPGL
jgi:zinc resistance-associated protein